MGPDGLVLAFEPLPFAAEKLQKLLAYYGLDGRVHLHREALARERGRRPFFVVGKVPELSGLRSHPYGEMVPDAEIEVSAETIDSVMNANPSVGRVSFVKLDLEGEEFAALRGAERTLRTHRPCCVFENGLEFCASDYGAEEFFGYFNALEYDLYDILGCAVDNTRWSWPGPGNFIAIHRAESHGLLPLMWTSVIEEMLASHWSPGLLGPPQQISHIATPPT